MMISLELGPEFQQTLASLSSMGDRVALATSKGLGLAVEFGASNVQNKYLSGQSLKMRSGNLVKAVTGWKESAFDAVIGVNPGTPQSGLVKNYMWQLGDETKTITAKKPGGMLAIPIGKDYGGYALSGAGLLKDKYSGSGSLRDRLPDAFVIESKGRLLLGIQPTKRSKFRPLFVLVPSVTVHGSGALADGVLDAVDGMTNILESEITKELA